MGGSGIADRLIAWVLALIGRVPGSLGVATVGACTLIGAISGRQHRDSRCGRPRALSEPGARRLRHALLGRPRLVERLDRHRDPAEHRDDPIRRLRGAIDREAVRRRVPARTADRLHDVGLRGHHGAAHRGAHQRGLRPAALPAHDLRSRPRAADAGVHPLGDLSRLVLADRSRRLRLPLRDHRRALRLPHHDVERRARLCRHLGHDHRADSW